MPITTTHKPPVIRIMGPDFAPPDLVLASRADQEAYWRQVALIARDAKYRELHQGIDIHGQRHYRKRKRRDGASGPFLLPHYSESRFRTELRWDQFDGRGAILYWVKPWAAIVGYWAEGVRGVVHNVVGFTAKSIDRIKQLAFRWWSGQARNRVGRQAAGRADLGAQEARLGIRGTRIARAFPPIFRPRHQGLPIEGVGPTVPTNVPAVVFDRREPSYTIMQRMNNLWSAAGVRRTTRAAIEATVTSLDATQDAATLIEVARRFGVIEPIPNKARAVAIIRANLVERWRSGRPFGKPPAEPTPPPGPPPQPPKPPQRPRTPPASPMPPARVTVPAATPARRSVPTRPQPVPIGVPVGAGDTPPVAARSVFDAMRLRWLSPLSRVPGWVRGFLAMLSSLGGQAAVALFAKTEPTLSTDFLRYIAAAVGMQGPWDSRETIVSALRDHFAGVGRVGAS